MNLKPLPAPGTHVAKNRCLRQSFLSAWLARFDQQSDSEATILRQVRERFLGPNVLRSGS